MGAVAGSLSKTEKQIKKKTFCRLRGFAAEDGVEAIFKSNKNIKSDHEAIFDYISVKGHYLSRKLGSNFPFR